MEVELSSYQNHRTSIWTLMVFFMECLFFKRSGNLLEPFKIMVHRCSRSLLRYVINDLGLIFIPFLEPVDLNIGRRNRIVSVFLIVLSPRFLPPHTSHLHNTDDIVFSASCLVEFTCVSKSLNLDGWLSSAHSLSDQTEYSHRWHEKNKVIKLLMIRLLGLKVPFVLTAFLEYALSSASVRASTKSRRRFGRFAFEILEIYHNVLAQIQLTIIDCGNIRVFYVDLLLWTSNTSFKGQDGFG